MSNIRRNILLVGAVVCILVTSGTAVAITETDNTDDVWHYQETDSGWSWEKYTGDKPNLDITEVSQSFDGSKVTLTLKVDGEIENSKDITYILYLEGDNSDYGAYYTNNEGYVGGKGEASGFYNMLDNPVSGNTFSATFEVDNPDESYNVYGYTQEYIGSEEHWGDYAPNEYAPWYSKNDDTTDDDTTGGGEDNTTDDPTDEDSADNATDDEGTDDTSNGKDSSGNGTPGFEILSLFVATIAVLLVLTKRKKYQ